jgi:putative MFS transporter
MKKTTRAPSPPPGGHKSPFNVIVIVAALGYFVDIYDLLLFSIVRVPSLQDLGLGDDEVKRVGVMLLDWQMAGLLVGGVLWGVLGDVRGRLSVLFGSIITYSLANIANGFVTGVDAYAALRFIAGIGLAGELGAGVTLVSETMHREYRGLGTTLVASFGVLGATVAFLVGDLFDWRTAYFVGGGLGIVLLLLRFSTYESGMFEQLRHSGSRRARFWLIFQSRDRVLRYLACIGIGLPIWYAIGLLVVFSKELSVALGITPAANPGQAIFWAYLGLALGDVSSGLLSQRMRSRKKAVALFLTILGGASIGYHLSAGASLEVFYALCAIIGFAAGYWALFVTIASEQFGTDIRSTVTTTVPNFVRGAVIPFTLLYLALHEALGDIEATAVVGVLAFGLAALSLRAMRETFGRDLDYAEDDAPPEVGA